jgi:VWFA-related protein
MVVFSDGEDTFSRISQAELMRLVHSSAVTIYPIMFTGKSINPDSAGQAKAFMRELAERTGGRIFAVTQAGDLPDIYRAIVEDLEGQYVLGFVSSDTRQDGAYRKLKVDVKRKDVRLRHREGYYAPTGQ